MSGRAPSLLVISPHLDDAAFSCGGAMALLAGRGWTVWMATVFTRSVHPATGFALACQLDKGLGAEIDYMALRRAEDEEAARCLGVAEVRWLDLPEAPHRGYDSAPALFGPPRPDDAAWREIVAPLHRLIQQARPSLMLLPQGLGGHVDHCQVIRAGLACAGDLPLAFYRDTPYAIRDPAALPPVTLPALAPSRLGIAATMEQKLAAACAYRSQIGFQFGGAAAAAASLRDFAAREGGGEPAERFLGLLAA